MSVIKDAIEAMKEMVLLSDKVERAGKTLTDISQELREYDCRLIVIETTIVLPSSKEGLTKQNSGSGKQEILI